MNNNMKIIGILLSITIVVFLIFYFTKRDSKKIEQLHNEYKLVQKEIEINGRITDLYINKGACFISLDSKKIFIKTSANYLYKEVYLDRVLEVGDTIIKKSGSDTIKVYKMGKEYYFKLGSFINRR